MGMIENMTDMFTNSGMMNDNLIATAFLNDCKVAVANYAVAITETSNRELREIYKQQLEDAIEMHTKVYRYMEKKGLYHAQDLRRQIEVDLQNFEIATDVAHL